MAGGQLPPFVQRSSGQFLHATVITRQSGQPGQIRLRSCAILRHVRRHRRLERTPRQEPRLLDLAELATDNGQVSQRARLQADVARLFGSFQCALKRRLGALWIAAPQPQKSCAEIGRRDTGIVAGLKLSGECRFG